MGNYYTFDRINNERVLSFYSKKPMDFGGTALEGEGRRRLIEEIESDFGYRFRAVVKCTRQVHGDRIVIVDGDSLGKEPGEADGLLTDLAGVALEIHTADCQSVFLYDPARGVIGNVHSGWKGTAQQIVPKAVSLMTGHYGCRPADIEVYINPSILGCCFEIEEDVVERFRTIVDVPKYCRKDRVVNGRQKYFMDTAAVNRDLLAAMGILPEHVFLSGVCTMCGAGRPVPGTSLWSAGISEYHSYRGDHHKTGRNGSMICLKTGRDRKG